MFEAAKFARESGVSAPTISNYLRILEAIWLAQRIKPFSEGKKTERYKSINVEFVSINSLINKLLNKDETFRETGDFSV